MTLIKIDKGKDVARWIAVSPASFVAAYAAWFLGGVSTRFSLFIAGLSSTELVGRGFTEAASTYFMGVAFVIAGMKTAPARHRIVGLSLAGLSILLVGVMLSPALFQQNWWAVWSGLWLGVGVASSLVVVLKET